MSQVQPLQTDLFQSADTAKAKLPEQQRAQVVRLLGELLRVLLEEHPPMQPTQEASDE